MKTENFKQKRDGILSVFNQSRNDLAALNAEIEKEVDANTKEFDRIRAENENLLELRDDNLKALKFFSKLSK